MLQRNILLLLVAAAIFLFLFVLRSDHNPRNPQLSERMDRADELGYALSRFRHENNGLLPERLSQLIPNYVATSNLVWFFPPPANMLPRPNEISNAIDQRGAFVYLGKEGLPIDMLFYDRPELWKQGHAVVIVDREFLTQIRPINEVELRLAQLVTNRTRRD